MRPPRNTILAGDALARLRELPPASIDAVVTSPPYALGVRDYGVAGQLGQEPTVQEWVENLAAVFAEIARVLRPAGSVWLNVSDVYSRSARSGAPEKSLACGPERLLLRLLADGWTCRNKVVWAKPNPMPQSARDRLSPTYEVLYLLTRGPYYFFDLDRIRVPLKTASRSRAESLGPLPEGNAGLARLKAKGLSGHRLGRNPGDVWTIAKPAYRGAHSATFPAKLIEQPILATCPERVCTACGRGWRRPVVRAATTAQPAALGKLRGCRCRARLVPGLVLDPFFGTGTLGEVAMLTNRDWLGIEISPAYRRLARARLRKVARFGFPNKCGTVESKHGKRNHEARSVHRRPSGGTRTDNGRSGRGGRRLKERRPRLGGRRHGAQASQPRWARRRAGGRS